MREYPVGTNQCQWTADAESSCSGPSQSCILSNDDADNDTIIDNLDNCPNTSNTDQADNDSDGLGNVCDDTPDGELAYLVFPCQEFTIRNYAHVQ